MATEDPVLYYIELGGTTYRVTTVKGDEALSQTYRFDITLHVDPTDALDPDALIGSDAALLLSRKSCYYWNLLAAKRMRATHLSLLTRVEVSKDRRW